ncbi:unnamed protein product [Ectocarpus sp. CCAP 1310/34]|nr:unnamed protein product [Ectocarpus sp. CCAP 1310/34]
MIRQSMSPWAAQCLRVKKDGTLRLCIDWRELNKLLVSDSGDLGDMQAIFDGLKGKKYFTQLDLASRFHQMVIAVKDRYKKAFRDADAEEDAFQYLRDTLASPKVLAFRDLERPFELHTDASTLGVEASLMPTIDGVTSAVAIASHRFSQTDARRGPTERECMGVLWAVEHFRSRFKLVTDWSALTWLFRSRELCPKLHRWALRLMEYDLELEWKAGVEHVLPDAWSRLPVANPVEVDVDGSFPDTVVCCRRCGRDLRTRVEGCKAG